MITLELSIEVIREYNGNNNIANDIVEWWHNIVQLNYCHVGCIILFLVTSEQ